MCGIAGILYPRQAGRPLERRLDGMCESLAHRGPDERGTVLVPEAGLANTRLILLDAPGGKQPMADPTGRYHLTFNGQIYNHGELRDRLAPHYTFRTRSDTEVLLAAYIVLGESCVELLDGMFAFVVWDAVKQEGFAARDALGVKPLVFARHDGECIVASECKAILRAWDRSVEINESALAEFVVVPALSGVRQPLFEGMEFLPAGCRMRITRTGVHQDRWFRYRVGDAGENGDASPEALRRALERSVSLNVQADEPVGTMLSGGIDSSLLTSLACRNGEDLHAFTIRFEDHEEIDFDSSSIVISDDAPYVDALERSLPLTLHRVHAPQQDLLEHLEVVAQVDDRIPVWEQELSQYFLAKTAAEHCKAVMVGDAADETHFGYFFLLRDGVNYGPRGLMDLFSAERRAACLAPRLRRSLDPLAWLESEYRTRVEEAGYAFGRSRDENIQAMTYLVVTLWLGRLLHNGDVHTMAHGLEARVPYANRGVVTVAQSVVPAQGFRDDVEKAMLRRAASPWLPEAICRRKKSALPRDPRLGRRYQERLALLLEEGSDLLDRYLDREEIGRLCRQAVLTENERILLFNLITLLYWGRCYHAG